VKRLLELGADPNTRRGQNNLTALESATFMGRLDTVQLLLNSKINTEGYGRVQYVSSIHLATERGNTAIANLLRKHRPWTTEDETMLDQLCHSKGGCDFKNFFHPAEYSQEQLLEIIAENEAILTTRGGPRFGLWQRCMWTRGLAIRVQNCLGHAADTSPSRRTRFLDEAEFIVDEASRELDRTLSRSRASGHTASHVHTSDASILRRRHAALPSRAFF